MKSYFLGLFVVISIIISPAVFAAQFYKGDEVQLDKTVDTGNVYIGGGNVSVTSAITGDLFVAGGNVRVHGPVAGDLFVSGGDITIDGNVTGDVRVAGGKVSVASDIGGELMVGAGSVEITSKAQVGDVWVGAGELVVAGTANSITAALGQLTVEDGARITKDIHYISDKEATISQGAHIEGEITRRIPPQTNHAAKKSFAALFVGGSAIWLISSLAMLLLFAYLFPHTTAALTKDWKQNAGTNMLWGIIALIVVPIVAIILCISAIGIPLGLITFLLYALALYAAKLLTALSIGAWVKSMWSKGADPDGKTVDWVAALAGLIIITILRFIPVLGGLILFIAFITALGSLLKHVWELLKNMHKEKKL